MTQLHNVDRLLEEFNVAAGDAKEYLDEMLANLSDGKVPGKDIF